MVSPICPHFLQTFGTPEGPSLQVPPRRLHLWLTGDEPRWAWGHVVHHEGYWLVAKSMTKFIQNLIKSIFTTNSIPCTSTCISLYSISSSVQNDGLSKLELSLGSANHFWSLNNGSQQPGLIVLPSRQEFMLPFKICQPFSGFEAWPQENGNTSYRCTIDFDGQLLLVQ